MLNILYLLDLMYNDFIDSNFYISIIYKYQYIQ